MLFVASWKPSEGRVPVPEIRASAPSPPPAAEPAHPPLGTPQLAREVFAPQAGLPQPEP